MKQSTLNRVWAQLILTALYRAGVRDICIAPGSRSTPLTLEAHALRNIDNNVRLHTHFDERGLGFLALGLAKSSNVAVAIIVTSGTAVANLLPAVTESRLTREKLVVVSADRPIELIDCGANQAINQRHLFGEQADFFCDLPSPCATISPAWLVSMLDEHSFLQAQRGGTLHVNCPFPEPLYGEKEDASGYLLPVKRWLDTSSSFLSFTPNIADLSSIIPSWQTFQHQKGLIIAANMDAASRVRVGELAQMLGWPLLCDPQAGKGSAYAGFDVWLQNQGCFELLQQAECVIQFGARLVSKRLKSFVGDFQGNFWLVDPHFGRLDEYHLPATRIVARPDVVANTLITSLGSASADSDLENREKPRCADWASALGVASARYFALLNRYVQEINGLSEMAIATDFAHWLAPQTDVFIGNSLAIRLLDMCCQLPDVAVFANRGASGIDGLIATACGVQRIQQRPMVCFLGDTSALYDLNSFALLAKNRWPLVVMVINNDGGGIFDLLPVPAEQKEAFYRQPHGFDFAHAAAMFGLNYCAPNTISDARAACLNAQQQFGTTVLELQVPAGESGRQLPSLFSGVANANLC